ncbi:MAG TPA: alkaline phosphatase D family protein [Candidatus Kapabacteria bacterium]|nr:alkaline phosphatase D family protein [Candidatus Kapabacteria bacterium]
MKKKEIILGPIIGEVTHKTAKIWFYGTLAEDESQKPFCHAFDKDKMGAIPGSPFEFVEVSKSSYDIAGLLSKAFLAEITFPDSGEEICFGINYDRSGILKDELKYTVKSAPDKGDIPFSFGLISCHKAYKSIPVYQAVVARMWNFLYDKLTEKKSSFLLQVGDQVYCDLVENNAFEKCKNLKDQDDHKQMVDFYREIYTEHWGFPEVQRVMSTFPQYMILDDHEILNAWGSNIKHRTDYLKIFDAAREAYVEFQHSHNPASLRNGELHYAFYYGSAAFLVMDLRSHRGENKGTDQYPLAGKEQWEDIENWLKNDRVKESKVLFVVTSVPVFHLSPIFTSQKLVKLHIEDHWSTNTNKNERRKLLKLLLDWSDNENKQIFILGGDIHLGTEVCAREERTGKNIQQITSSPITNKPTPLPNFIAELLTNRFYFTLVENDKKSRMMVKFIRRHRKRNFAIIEVDYKNGIPGVKLNMYRDGRPSLQTNDLICKCKEI